MTFRARIPVTILTGYLGSGKTTLLQRLLSHPEGQRAAVLINEFGEISLDHLLARSVSGSTVVLKNGCVCCSVREDLREGLRDLLDARDRKTIPDFDRIIIETSGLADPVPIVQTLVADPMLGSQVRLSCLVTTVDAMNAVEQLTSEPEALCQAGSADRLVITKSDLCKPGEVERIVDTLSRINPAAPVLNAAPETNVWQLLSERPEDVDPDDTARRQRPMEAAMTAPDHAGHSHHPLERARHAAGITSFVFRTRQRIDWTAFAVWLSLLVHRHGRQVLRVKGLLDVDDARGPLCLNAVQHFVHPPEHLDSWPDDDRSSRLVFIVRHLDEADIVNSLRSYLARTELPEDRQAEAFEQPRARNENRRSRA